MPLRNHPLSTGWHCVGVRPLGRCEAHQPSTGTMKHGLKAALQRNEHSDIDVRFLSGIRGYNRRFKRVQSAARKRVQRCNCLRTTVRLSFSLPLILSVFLFAFCLPAHSQSLSNAVFQKHKTQVESAVERGLEHLANAQKSDGTFEDAYGRSVGVVSLAGMAFLSAGHTPGYGEYSEVLNNCIDYVLSSQRSNGLLDHGDSGHGLMYAHNIATLFLSEISGMVEPRRQEKLERVLSRATRLILAAQAERKNENNAGGWRYKPDSKDSDLSCSGWALMALRSGKLNGAGIPDESIDKAVRYVLRNHHKESGRFGYTDPWRNSETLTGCGLLCLELSGFHGTESTYRAGDFILQHRKLDRRSSAHEYYANYYNAQAMFQLGGGYWEQYADWMYQSISPQTTSPTVPGQTVGSGAATALR